MCLELRWHSMLIRKSCFNIIVVSTFKYMIIYIIWFLLIFYMYWTWARNCVIKTLITLLCKPFITILVLNLETARLIGNLNIMMYNYGSCITCIEHQFDTPYSINFFFVIVTTIRRTLHKHWSYLGKGKMRVIQHVPVHDQVIRS